MKRILLCLFLFSIVYVGKGQNPPLQPSVAYGPSCPVPVGLIDSIILIPNPNTLGYTWISNSGGIIIAGQPLPYTTTSNKVTIEFIGIVPVWDICVFAFNSWGNSDTSCLYYNAIPNISFHPNCDSTVAPNSSVPYAISNGNCLAGATWSITGDADINGINDTVFTGNFVTINFGPAFTTGILCVYGITTLNLVTDTICMTINAPTGMDEFAVSSSEFTIYPNPAGNELFVNGYSLNGKEKEINIYDVEGRKVLRSIINHQSTIINIQSLQSGIYFIEINNVRKKVVKESF